MDFYSPQVIWDFLEDKTCPQELGIQDVLESDHEKKRLKIVDVLGRDTILKQGVIQWYIFNDGSVEKHFVVPD